MDEIEIIVSVTWFAYIALMVYINAIIIKQKEIVNHARNLTTGIICGAILSCFYLPSIVNYIWCIGNLGIVYWLLFDIGLNKSVGWTLQFVGKTAFMDRLLRKISFGQPILFKLVLLIVFNGVMLLI